MRVLANIVITIGLISLMVGIIVKTSDIAPLGSKLYSLFPISFLRFANTCFLFVIALAAVNIVGKKK